MDKLGRTYTLRIGAVEGSDPIIVTLPFTLEMDITRNTLTSANVCQVRVYNLSQKHRNQIRFNASDYGTFRRIELFAGYNDNPPKVFDGNISQAWSFREGVNFITQIECYDGGFAFINGVSDIQFPKNVDQKTVITTLAGNLPHVTVGAIGNTYAGSISKGNTYSGNTADLLSDVTGGGFFIDNGKVNALGTNEYISEIGEATLVVNSKSGLLGTPLLERTIVRFEMLFEPSLNPGRKVRLESITEENFNTDYKVTGVKHRGMISEAVCGSLITTGEFFYSKLLNPVNPQ